MTRKRKPDAPAAAPEPKEPTAQLNAPLGQGALWSRAVRAARTQRLHHAVVLSGPSGCGKSTAARWLAASLLCPSDLDQDGPCGICRTCRKVASGQHPDLHLLAPEEDKREIRVDAVRELLESLQRHSVEGGARVVLLDPASALNVEGQNALLKTLEEPGEQTFLILATDRPEALLPTVRSRCERIGIRRLPRTAVLAELGKKIPAAYAMHEAAADRARGRLGVALQACTEQAVQIHDLVRRLLAADNSLRPLAFCREVLALFEERGGGQRAARAFLQGLRDEASGRLRALAVREDGSYLGEESRPWTDLLTLALGAEQDLDVQIPAEQALVGLLLRWSRGRRVGPS